MGSHIRSFRHLLQNESGRFGYNVLLGWRTVNLEVVSYIPCVIM